MTATKSSLRSKLAIGIVAVLCLAGSLAILSPTPPIASGSQVNQDLGPAAEYKILYAGDSGGPREKRYLEMLKHFFVRVESISIRNLNSKTAAPYDIVVADWKRRYVDGKYASGHAPCGLEKTFAKPIIMIGAVAGDIQHHSKLDWL